MAGGEGTRLRPLTSNQPKPMVPIAGKPCMEHILELVRGHGITQVVATLAYMPQIIRGYFGEGSQIGLELDYSVEEIPAGTAGSVKLLEHYLDDTFLVVSGDAVTDVDLGAFLEAHRRSGAAATLALKRVSNPLEFGVVVTAEDGRIERFLEKPSWGEVFSDTINTGIYALEPEVLAGIPEDEPFDFSKQLFPELLNAGVALHGHVVEGYWQDVGNLIQYQQANRDALDRKVKLEIAGVRLRENIWIGEGSLAENLDAISGPAVIGNYCAIDPRASIGRYTVLGNNVIVKESARTEHSVIDSNCYIGPSARVRGSIVGKGTEIGAHASISDGDGDRRRMHDRRAERDRAQRAHLPVQARRNRCQRSEVPDLAAARGVEAVLRPGCHRDRQRRDHAGDRHPPCDGVRHGTAARRPRRRQPRPAPGLAHDQAGDERRAGRDRSLARRPAHHDQRDQPLRAGQQRGARRLPRPDLGSRSRADRDRLLREQRRAGHGGNAQGDREALQPPRAAPRPADAARRARLPGSRHGELRQGGGRQRRRRPDPLRRIAGRDRLRLLQRRPGHAGAAARFAGRVVLDPLAARARRPGRGGRRRHGNHQADAQAGRGDGGDRRHADRQGRRAPDADRRAGGGDSRRRGAAAGPDADRQPRAGARAGSCCRRTARRRPSGS